MATKIKKDSVLYEYLTDEKRKEKISGVQFKDGLLLIGQIGEVLLDPDYGLWFTFEGISPLSPKQDASLTEFLELGLKNPDALQTRGLFQLSQVDHFIFMLSTENLRRKVLQKLKKNHEEDKVVDFSKDTKIEMEIAQEKIKEDKVN